MNLSLRSLRARLRRALPDSLIVRWQYRAMSGRWLHLRHPRGFHEKICRMRLDGLTPLHAFCTDKVTAPAYIASRIGPGWVPERYLATRDPDRIGPDTIPARSCMIKTSHDSGGVFPVPDTATADWDALRARLRNRLGTSYYLNKRESQYRSIPPAVVVEELLRPDPGGAVSDLKLFCFHGKVRFMVLIFQGMRDKTSQRRFFDRDWIPLEVNRTRHGFRLGMAPRPEGLERIIAQAEALAEPFAFVRVDFLLANGRRYVGELTFTPTAGYERFHPDAFERAAGDMLDLHRATPDWRPYLRAAQRFLPPEGPSAAISPQVAAEEKRVAEAAR